MTNLFGLSDSFTFAVTVSDTCSESIVYSDTSLTECPGGQELSYFYYGPSGDSIDSHAITWCGAAAQVVLIENTTDPFQWQLPFLLEQCVPGVSWSYSHAFGNGSRYYSPPYRNINMVCQTPPP